LHGQQAHPLPRLLITVTLSRHNALLLDEHLLQCSATLAADLLGEVGGIDAQLDGPLIVGPQDVGRYVAAGQLDLDQVITIRDEDIQHYGTGVIQEPDAPREYTVRELAALMIEASDNTAAYVLEHLIGQDAIQQDLAHWGLTRTSMADNLSTPLEAATLLGQIYRHELLDAQAADVVITLLEHTYFADRLQTGVPDGVAVAHKVGSDVGIFNDDAIIFNPRRPYAVAVLSSAADEDEANGAFAKLSRDLYDFESTLATNGR